MVVREVDGGSSFNMKFQNEFVSYMDYIVSNSTSFTSYQSYLMHYYIACRLVLLSPASEP
jgi:hypothetical protein